MISCCVIYDHSVLNVTEVASNTQLLRWPLRQGYLETPLCVEWLLARCGFHVVSVCRTTRAEEEAVVAELRTTEDDD